MINKLPKSALLLLSAYLVLAIFVMLYFDGTGDSGDSILHYLYAKHAVQHPQNLLSHWAKPVFTLIATPFAQFGFVGMKLMNVIIVFFTLLFTFNVASLLGLKNALMSVVFLIFSPLYFALTFSGLTEPLFALCCILNLYLVLKDKFTLSALLLSFLPFVRSEGLIIVGVFALFFIFKKEWKTIPWLAFGHLIYSIIGYFYFHDFLWVFAKIPYVDLESVYGSGNLFHFVDQMIFVVGVPLYVLFWIGLLVLMIKSIRQRVRMESSMLILGGFLAFFIAHSLFWYLGIFNSFGLKRVLIGVIPFISIITLYGFNFISEELLQSQKKVKLGGQILIVALVLIFPFTKNHAALQIERDLKLNKDQILAKEIVSFLNESGKSEHRTVYAPTYFSEILDVDHFNPDERFTLSRDNFKYLEPGDIIIWESWHAGFENRVDASIFLDNKSYTLLKEYQTLEGTREIRYLIFEKVTSN